MKMVALFVVVVGLLAGCSKEKERQAALQKRFSSIDSNFVADIAAANSNEQVWIDEDQHRFSNDIMSMKLPLTNVEMATSELLSAVDKETTKAFLLMSISEKKSDLLRAEATNQMLLAKLSWFYTNSMPVGEDAPSNNIENIVLALSSDLTKKRNNDIVDAGLRQINQLMASITNSPPPPTAEEIARDKKHQQLADYKLWSETTSVQRTAVRLVGEVLQVIDGGMLVRYNISSRRFSEDYKICLVQDLNLNSYAEKDKLNGLVVYPVGNYNYDSKGGDNKTVRRFTASLDRAVEWNRNPQ